MDASFTRRGQPCWYRVEGVGLMAVNDALLLEGAIFQMIRKHFRKDPYYVDLLDLMHEVRSTGFPLDSPSNPWPQVSYQTEMGQLVDLITAPEDRVDLSKFNLSRYSTLFLLASFSQLLFPDNSQTQDNCSLQDCRLLLLPPRCACTARLRIPRGEEE
jgi:farnesyl diphosphate synthase